jgi:MFS transporter, FSR family, fosmidomycin resistance protein
MMLVSTDTLPKPPGAIETSDARRRSLVAASLAHALHDGYTDSIYAFLPVWQAQFGLSYATMAVLRALYYASMGGLQMPADHVLRAWSSRRALLMSTLLAALGLAIVALPWGAATLCMGLVVAGAGSSIQHPRASMLVADAYGRASRGPLGIYNFSGDLGKATLPALVALLLPVMAWPSVLWLMAALGVLVAMALARWIPRHPTGPGYTAEPRPAGSRHGFTVLMTIGALDTATRMGYLLFLPFLVHGKGGGSSTVGVALALLFAGGALGKAVCSWIGGRLGVTGSVMATEAATGVLIVATLFTPLSGTLLVLPLLGMVLNGTSSILYAMVPDFARGDTSRAFARFYTGVIVSGGLAPIVYGALADHSSRTIGIVAAAVTATVILPLVAMLRLDRSGAPLH